MKNWIKQVLESERRLVIPIMTHPGIEGVGKQVKDAVTSGVVHYEAIRYLSDNYASDACTVIMDLTVEAEVFGAEVNIPDDEVPTVIGRLVCDEASVQALSIPSLTAGRIPQYLLANRLAAENITNKPVFSGCIGPYSLAGRLYDMSEIMVAIYIEPDTILELLSKCTHFLIDYCKALKETGTAGVIIAEPAAGLLSNEDCMAYSTQFVKQIVEEVQDEHFTVILHNCGNTGQCTQAMLETGANALHFGNAINMQDVLKECPQDVIVMGNLAPVGVIKQGTPTSVLAEVSALLESTRLSRNFILSTGCDVPPHAPEANIRAFFEAVETFNDSI